MEIMSEDEYFEEIDTLLPNLVIRPKKDSEGNDKPVTIDDWKNNDYYNALKSKNLNVSENFYKVLALLDLADTLPILMAGGVVIFKPSNKTLMSNYNKAKEVLQLVNMSESEIVRIGMSGDEKIEDLEFVQEEPFVVDNPDILSFLQKLSETVEGEIDADSDNVQEGLDDIIQMWRKFDLTNKNDREKIYNYWESTEEIFDQLGSYSIRAKKLSEEVRTAERSLQTPNVTLEGDFGNIFDEVLTEEQELFLLRLVKKKIRFPKYTVTFTENPSFEQMENRLSLIKLVNNFVQPMMGDTEEYTANFDAEENRNYQEERATQDTDTGTETTETASFDASAQAEGIQGEIRMAEKSADPLTLLSAHLTSKFYVTQEMGNEINEKIRNELSSSLVNTRPEIIESRLRKIEGYVESLVSDMVPRDSYKFAIIDDSKNSSFLDKLKKRKGRYSYELEYYELEIVGENLVLVKYETIIDGYVKYVNEVNRMVKNLYAILNEGKRVSRSTIYNPNRARGGTTGSGQTSLTQGRNYPALPGKFAEENPTAQAIEISKYYDDLIELANSYYYEPMDSRYFFKADAPDFTRDNNYKKIISLSTKSRKTALAGIKRGMTTKKKIPIDADDLQTLTSFFEQIKYFSELSSQQVKDLVESVAQIFKNLYLINLNVPKDQKRKTVTGITRKVEESLGSFAYKLLSQSGKFRDEIPKEAQIQVFEKPLIEYKNVGTSLSDLNLFNILEDEDFQKYSSDNKMGKKLKALLREMNTSPLRVKQELTDVENMYKAQLEALDLLKFQRDDMIYKAYLQTENVEHVEYVLDMIEKQNRIDLYARDIEGIIESNKPFNDLSYIFGVSPDVIYKVKGLFR